MRASARRKTVTRVDRVRISCANWWRRDEHGKPDASRSLDLFIRQLPGKDRSREHGARTGSARAAAGKRRARQRAPALRQGAFQWRGQAAAARFGAALSAELRLEPA